MGIIKSHKPMLYMAGNLLFLIGLAVTIIGLALVQDECKDTVEDAPFRRAGLGQVPFFTEPVGEDCKKGFRFFWFILALDAIPPLLAVAAVFMPDLARGVSTSYFAVIAPLNILMANSFFDAAEITVGDMERRMKVAMAGFCLVSAGALLMLLLDSLLAGAPAKSSVRHADAAHKSAGSEAVSPTQRSGRYGNASAKPAAFEGVSPAHTSDQHMHVAAARPVDVEGVAPPHRLG